MKSKIRNYGVIAFTALFSLIATASFANNGTGNGDNPLAALKFLGNVKDQPVFQLDLNSEETKEFTIAIKDIYGNILYSERVKAKTYTRVFKVDTNQVDDDVLHVEVKSDKGKTEVFTINRDRKLVEETTISKQ